MTSKKEIRVQIGVIDNYDKKSQSSLFEKKDLEKLQKPKDVEVLYAIGELNDKLNDILNHLPTLTQSPSAIQVEEKEVRHRLKRIDSNLTQINKNLINMTYHHPIYWITVFPIKKMYGLFMFLVGNHILKAIEILTKYVYAVFCIFMLIWTLLFVWYVLRISLNDEIYNAECVTREDKSSLLCSYQVRWVIKITFGNVLMILNYLYSICSTFIDRIEWLHHSIIRVVWNDFSNIPYIRDFIDWGAYLIDNISSTVVTVKSYSNSWLF